MGFFTSPDDILMDAMQSRQTQVHLSHCIGSLDGVFRSVLQRDRRLLAVILTYEASYLKKGLVQFSYDYDVTIEYQVPGPDDINNVIVDDGQWDASEILTKGSPKELTIVTSDSASLYRRLSDLLPQLIAKYEGIHGYQAQTMTLDKVSTDTMCALSYSYLLPLHQLRQMQGKAAFAAKNIWRTILGKSNVPQFVKPFLAVSYLAQECCYDQRAFDEVESNPKALPTDPIPLLAYGPLIENRGICGGFSWAFKTLMDEVHIECICVSGFLKEDLKTGHQWNMVKMDGQYYHVDPTWGIKDDGVSVQALMQPDSILKNTHIWDTAIYPAARSMHFDYDYVEDFLAENGDEYLDDGANEKYFFPEKIFD